MKAEEAARAYDALAPAYANKFFHELDGKPVDRALLDLFAAEVRGGGRAADVGCGPGHIARYLTGRGVDVVGIDVSPEMVRTAQRLSPGLSFETGSLLGFRPGRVLCRRGCFLRHRQSVARRGGVCASGVAPRPSSRGPASAFVSPRRGAATP